MESSYTVDSNALQRFDAQRSEAVDFVSRRFFETYPDEYARFGERGQKACREDLEFQLEFLRPVLEFGVLQPFLEYQRWLAEVLDARHIPVSHITQSLDWLAEFFEQRGDSSSNVVAALRETARQPLAARPPQTAGPDAEFAGWPEVDELAAALLEGNRRRAQSILAGLRAAGRSPIEIYVHLVQAALYEIGARWSRNLVTVAQEHLATATARTLMVEAISTAEFAPRGEQKAVLACVEGNQHAVGLQMVADALELAGWDVQNLGANMPMRMLLQHVAAVRPQLVGLSIAFPHQLGVARDTIRQLREQHGAQCPRILVGGLAVNGFVRLAEYLGADGHASDALAVLGLVTSSAQ